MKKTLNIIHAITTFIIGISGLGYSVFELFIENKLHEKYEGVAFLLAGLLSIVLIALGIERIQQRAQIEKEIEKIFPLLNDLKQQYINNPYCEVIVSQEKIVEETVTAMRKAKRAIRVTNFKGQKAEDTNIDYYYNLGQSIKNSDLNYFCCYLCGQKFNSRIEGFNKAGLESNHYERMTYFEFTNPIYFNLFIYDNDVAIIGFPLTMNEGKMRTAIKIRAISDQNKHLIESLSLWFDKVLIPYGIEKSWEELKSQ